MVVFGHDYSIRSKILAVEGLSRFRTSALSTLQEVIAARYLPDLVRIRAVESVIFAVQGPEDDPDRDLRTEQILDKIAVDKTESETLRAVVAKIRGSNFYHIFVGLLGSEWPEDRSFFLHTTRKRT
jgi:hypothetical protein